MEDLGQVYLTSVQKRFVQHRELAEKAMSQLDEKMLFLKPNENSNSIAIIIQHIAGNMISRWTDFLITDGEKEFRNRDAEFGDTVTSCPELMALWNRGWQCFLDALQLIKPGDLTQIIYIRKEPLRVIDAINRQLAHYPYHVGQIIYVAKLLAEIDFESLSIPKHDKR